MARCCFDGAGLSVFQEGEGCHTRLEIRLTLFRHNSRPGRAGTGRRRPCLAGTAKPMPETPRLGSSTALSTTLDSGLSIRR
jgi:hypothetical protein